MSNMSAAEIMSRLSWDGFCDIPKHRTVYLEQPVIMPANTMIRGLGKQYMRKQFNDPGAACIEMAAGCIIENVMSVNYTDSGGLWQRGRFIDVVSGGYQVVRNCYLTGGFTDPVVNIHPGAGVEFLMDGGVAGVVGLNGAINTLNPAIQINADESATSTHRKFRHVGNGGYGLLLDCGSADNLLLDGCSLGKHGIKTWAAVSGGRRGTQKVRMVGTRVANDDPNAVMHLFGSQHCISGGNVFAGSINLQGYYCVLSANLYAGGKGVLTGFNYSNTVTDPVV